MTLLIGVEALQCETWECYDWIYPVSLKTPVAAPQVIHDVVQESLSIKQLSQVPLKTCHSIHWLILHKKQCRYCNVCIAQEHDSIRAECHFHSLVKEISSQELSVTKWFLFLYTVTEVFVLSLVFPGWERTVPAFGISSCHSASWWYGRSITPVFAWLWLPCFCRRCGEQAKSLDPRMRYNSGKCLREHSLPLLDVVYNVWNKTLKEKSTLFKICNGILEILCWLF